MSFIKIISFLLCLTAYFSFSANENYCFAYKRKTRENLLGSNKITVVKIKESYSKSSYKFYIDYSLSIIVSLPLQFFIL